MTLKRFINRFVPMAILPRRYNVENLFRWAFERSSGRSLEQALGQSGFGPAYAKGLIDLVDENFGARMLSGTDDAGLAIAEAVATVTEVIINHPPKQAGDTALGQTVIAPIFEPP